jgi:hypothetical protein
MDVSAAGIASGLTSALASALVQISVLAAVLLLPALALAWIEKTSQGLLSRTFGWRSVLWTGWLGVPVHEISHWIACKLFHHEVSSMSLFSPDPRTGTLGYVNHTWNTGSLYQRSGLLFIGIAPVAGGTLLMFAIASLILPAPLLLIEGGRIVTAAMIAPTREAMFHLASYYLWDLPGACLDREVLLSWRTWLAVYALMCIGLHMNPSREDLRGGWPTLLILPAAIVSVNIVAQPFGGIPISWLSMASAVLAPVVSALLIALVMNLASLLCIKGITLIPARGR